MTEQNIFDLAVIGAGPAGSVAAYAAAARGLKVALVDQRDFPRDKSCGDGLGPGGYSLLKRLRLEHIVADMKPIGQISILGPDGSEAASDVPVIDGEPQHGYVVARETLDDRLFRAALELGATDFSGHKLTEISLGDDLHELTVRPSDAGKAGGEEAEVRLHCRLLVGADGAYSTVRRLLRTPAHPTRHTLLAMRAYADVPAEFEPRLIFEFDQSLLPGYGWIFPNGAGSVNVGVGLPVANIKSHDIGVRDRLTEFVERSRSRGLAIGELRGHRSHHLPHAGHIPALTRHRVAMVGDSAAMINPLTGEGIVYAMTSAAALVERLPDDLSDSGAVKAALQRYEGWYRAKYARHMWLSKVATHIMARPTSAAWAVKTVGKNPEVMTSVVKLLFDLGEVHTLSTMRSFLRATLARS